jgi:hypothetical protein
MDANQPADTLLRFGAFEADVQTGELRKQGKRVRLQEQPFQLLVMLLEAPGQLVTRDELRSKLWPQTTVDFDHGLPSLAAVTGSSPMSRSPVTGAQKRSPTILHTRAPRASRPRGRQHIKEQSPAILLDCSSALAWRSSLHPPYHGYSTMISILHPRFAPWRCCHWKMFPGTVRRIISPMA